jgi:hypothetical protein
MGFDLTGMNPQTDTPCPEWTKGEPFKKVKGTKNQYEIDPQIKEEYDDYMKSKCAWQEENDGAYFRNNVWFWRPLWSYVCSVCYDILSDKDVEKGQWNDGKTISKTKAKKIARKLRQMFREGHVELTEAKYKIEQEQMDDKDWNKSYPFSVENVRAFERFCENSGGFQIW